MALPERRRARRTAAPLLLVAALSAAVLGATMLAAGLRATPDPYRAGALPGTVSTAPSSAPGAAGASRATTVPQELHLPDFGVVAQVDTAGVAADGALAVPDDPQRVGWWVGSALPGSAAGAVVIAGHVDHVDHGRGALFRLAELPLGAAVELVTDSRRHHYRVVARRSHPKESLPRDLFDRSTAPALALVTCGGTFTARDGYSHNVVVYAEPAPGPPAPSRTVD